MVYVGVALIVFKVTQLVRYWVDGPPWLTWVFTTALAVPALWLLGGEPKWAIAVAAGAGLLHRFESLLMAGADAGKVFVLRTTRRR